MPDRPRPRREGAAATRSRSSRRPSSAARRTPARDPAARAPMRVVAQDARASRSRDAPAAPRVRKTFRAHRQALRARARPRGAGRRRAGRRARASCYPGFMPPEHRSRAGSSRARRSSSSARSAAPATRPSASTSTATRRRRSSRAPRAWAGLDQGYFVSALFPAEPAGTCVFARGPGAGQRARRAAAPGRGRRARYSLTVYSGPKDLDHLRGYGRELRRPRSTTARWRARSRSSRGCSST